MEKALAYIHEQKHKHGKTDDELRPMFREVGWHPRAIEELFSSYHHYKHKIHARQKRLMQIGMIALVALFTVCAGFFIWLNWL